jgi:hypothetical protein
MKRLIGAALLIAALVVPTPVAAVEQEWCIATDSTQTLSQATVVDAIVSGEATAVIISCHGYDVADPAAYDWEPTPTLTHNDWMVRAITGSTTAIGLIQDFRDTSVRRKELAALDAIVEWAEDEVEWAEAQVPEACWADAFEDWIDAGRDIRTNARRVAQAWRDRDYDAYTDALAAMVDAVNDSTEAIDDSAC